MGTDGTVNTEHEMRHASARRANRTYGVPYKGKYNTEFVSVQCRFAEKYRTGLMME